jgi:hypothetical protein
MRYFDSTSKISQDACALEVKDRENESLVAYNTFNFYHADGSCSEVDQKVKELASQNPNLTFRVGYGVASACTVDNDNKLRYGSDLTRGPERQNLCIRNFVACPDFSRGHAIPNLESALLNGVDTLIDRDCYKLAETQLGVFQPLTPCVESYIKNASEVITEDLRIGKFSKDEFLAHRKSCVPA